MQENQIVPKSYWMFFSSIRWSFLTDHTRATLGHILFNIGQRYGYQYTKGQVVKHTAICDRRIVIRLVQCHRRTNVCPNRRYPCSFSASVGSDPRYKVIVRAATSHSDPECQPVAKRAALLLIRFVSSITIKEEKKLIRSK